MMFIICSHESKNGYAIYRCVESIRKFYQKNKIIVVDTGSQSLDYLSNLKNFDIEILTTGPNYELGAWKVGLNNFESENYICLQDSVFLLNPIDFLKQRDLSTYQIVHGGIATMPAHSQRLVFDTLNLYNIPFNEIHVVFGSMFMVSNNVRNKLINNNFFQNFYPKNKTDSYICERVFYCLFESFGLDVLNSGINGTEKGEGKYFYKEWLNRV